MSFGRPPSLQETFTLTPPQRGSFPLDHDGDCKTPMMEYLKCLKSNGQDNGKCRLLSRRYLECRMDNGLMERDSMHNLGLGDVGERSPERVAASTQDTPVANASSNDGAGAGGRAGKEGKKI